MKNVNESIVQPHVIHTIAMVILLIGGIDLGLFGIFGRDFIESVFGSDATSTRIIYSVIGFSALYKIFAWTKESLK